MINYIVSWITIIGTALGLGLTAIILIASPISPPIILVGASIGNLLFLPSSIRGVKSYHDGKAKFNSMLIGGRYQNVLKEINSWDEEKY